MEQINMKQVIVLRRDIKCRRGKLHVQAAHASLMSYLNALGNRDRFLEVHSWLTTHKQTKICVGVTDETELMEIYHKALQAGLPCALVTDAAHTEFDLPTRTSCGIGPASSEEIDKITGNLKLL